MSALQALQRCRRERPRWTAVAVATLAILLAWPVVDWWLRGIEVAPQFRFWDFGAYGNAVDRWQAGEALYVRNDNGGFHGSYLYPPFSVLLFYPFVALFEPDMTRLVWSAATVLFMWVGLQALVASLGRSLSVPERLLGLLALLGFQPFLLGIKMGQTVGVTGGLLALAGAGVVNDTAGRRLRGVWATLAGVTTALVGLLKLPFAPAGAHLLRSKRRFAAAVGTGLVLLALSVAVFGIDSHRLYLDVLAWGVESGGGARNPALWLPPYFKPLAWLSGSIALRLVGSAIVVAYAVLAADADREVFALGVASIPLLAPLVYTYYFTAVLPAVVVLLAVEFDHPSGRPTIPLVGLLLLQFHSYGLKFLVDNVPDAIPAFTALRPAYFLLQPGLWGSLVLVGLAAARVAEQVELPGWLDAWLADLRSDENDIEAD
ncbi:glycosyltransferase family 87 protein [Haloglomus litoreum]|uniref:glycosyltransferase family 87 protein n=1 Tax=Haloglomus litoreum TaxID=3034026 RepID=UPI0023E75EE1|nr:glycosyltransferase family 87 protein [Haloglomus sp. DT116]